MRFKDYIVKTAIQRNYKDKILANSDNSLLDNIYASLANKFGYKLIDEVKESDIKCHNKDWKRILTRYSYDKSNSPKRFLEYDVEDKTSYYFSEQGMIYKGKQGTTFELVSLLAKPNIYNKYSEFLEYVRYYFSKKTESSKQYLMLGYNDKHMYYVCTDGNFYFKFSESSPYKECTERLKRECLNLIEVLEQ